MHLYLPGISDDDTLQVLSAAIGSHRVAQASLSTEWNTTPLVDPGRRSSWTSWADQDLVPVWWLREQATGTAFALTRSMKPMWLTRSDWWQDPSLSARVPDEVKNRINQHYAELV